MLDEKTCCRNSLKPAFVKPFKTLENYYLYDVGSNRVFKVDEVIYTIIEMVGQLQEEELVHRFKKTFGEKAVIKALEEIRNDQAKGLFLNGYPSMFTMGFEKLGMQKKMDRELGQMLLEVSQDCNLDCHYCTFSGCYDGHRVHTHKMMSSKTMKKAVDLFFTHSVDKKKVTLSFYGGEPLLNLKVIKEAVAYVGGCFSDRRCGFSITTNGTLLTRELAEYFCKHDFSITLSIDGPKHIHDSHRLDKRGLGSYDRAIRGLKQLIEAYKDKSLSQLAINMVITPPHSLADIQALWDAEPWLPNDILVMADYVDEAGTTLFDNRPMIEKKKPITIQRNKKFAGDYFAGSVLSGEEKHPLGQAMYDKGLARMHKRPVFIAPQEKCHLNGCCIPGVRKVFVDAQGQLKICERVHDTPNVGDVDKGYDYQVIFKMIEDFEKGCREKCSSCWAVRFCGFCFAHAFKGGKYDQEFKDSHCSAEMNLTRSRLALYHYLLEKDPRCLDFLNNYEFE